MQKIFPKTIQQSFNVYSRISSLARRGVAGFAALAVIGLSLAMTAGDVVSAATPPATPTPPASKSASPSPSPANASSSAASQPGAIQGYAAETPLQMGTIVQLSGSGTSKVAAATSDKASQMFGVVVDKSSLSVTVSGTDLPNEAYVTTSGTYNVLVSTQNGPVNNGDYVTISSISGIGMMAQPEQKLVFGRAVGNFDGKSNVVGNAQLKTTDGKPAQKVAIGFVPVAIDIRHNPNEKSTKTNVPKFLQRIGEAIAEKPVSAIRMYLSIAITGISIIVAIIILSAGVRNAIISIGRNPLSRKSIFRALAEIILTSLIILTIGLFAVYLLLKL